MRVLVLYCLGLLQRHNSRSMVLCAIKCPKIQYCRIYSESTE